MDGESRSLTEYRQFASSVQHSAEGPFSFVSFFLGKQKERDSLQRSETSLKTKKDWIPCSQGMTTKSSVAQSQFKLPPVGASYVNFLVKFPVSGNFRGIYGGT
jgi:hypothetical protein